MDKIPPVPDWFKREITAGLQLLVVLNLKFAPASDAILATASAWVKVLYRKIPLANTQTNVNRIRQAFYDLSVECEEFPTPARFLKSLPPYKEPVVKVLKKEFTEEERKKNLARIRELKNRLEQEN